MRRYIDLINLSEDAYAFEDEATTPDEDARDERQRRIEQTIKDFCTSEVGLDMDGGYTVMFELDDHQITLSPQDDEISLVQLNKLSVLGEVMINASSKQWSLTIQIKTAAGFDLSRS